MNVFTEEDVTDEAKEEEGKESLSPRGKEKDNKKSSAEAQKPTKSLLK